MAYKKNSDKDKDKNNLSEFKKQLKSGRLLPLYLFYGNEDYLRETYIKRVADMIPDGGFPEFNHIKLEGNDIPLSEYDDAWESFPMMTDKKLIHIKNSGIFVPSRREENDENAAKQKEKKEFWTEKLKRISDDTVVIFDEAAVDKRGEYHDGGV